MKSLKVSPQVLEAIRSYYEEHLPRLLTLAQDRISGGACLADLVGVISDGAKVRAPEVTIDPRSYYTSPQAVAAMARLPGGKEGLRLVMRPEPARLDVIVFFGGMVMVLGVPVTLEQVKDGLPN